MTSPGVLPPATCQAIQDFLNGNDRFILKMGKDEQGRACFQLASKGLWTWFLSRILGLNSYQLRTIVHYIQTNQQAFDQLNLGSSKKIADFYQLLNRKIGLYNQKRDPGQRLNTTLSCLFQSTHFSIPTPIPTPISSPVVSSTVRPPIPPIAMKKSSLSEEKKTAASEEAPPLSAEDTQNGGPSIEDLFAQKNTSHPFPAIPPLSLSSMSLSSPPSPPLSPSAFPSSPHLGLEPQEVVESKQRLIAFYLNQYAVLEDLKIERTEALKKLGTAPKSDKEQIERRIIEIEEKIVEIEWTDLERSKTLLKVRKNGVDPSVETLAKSMGKSHISFRGLLLGQQYQKAITANFRSLLNIFKSLNPNLTVGFNLSKLVKSTEETITLADIVDQLQTTRQEAIDNILKLTAIAFNDKSVSSKMRHYAKSIDEKVAQQLDISGHDLQNWLQDLHIEMELNTQLTKLSTSFSHQSGPIIEADIKQICCKHALTCNQKEQWTCFKRGPIPTDRTKWTLILTPHQSDFTHTLKRALEAFKDIPYLQGKFTYMEKDLASDSGNNQSVPVLIFYFNGRDSEEQLKEAISLLEEEFVDADLIGNGRHPLNASLSQTSDELKPHTETVKRSALLHYKPTVEQSTERTQDPLSDYPSFTCALDPFLDRLHAYIDQFNHPQHLIKLQHILHYLNKENSPAEQALIWKAKIQTCMQRIISNMTIFQQESLSSLLNYGENLEDVRQIRLQASYQNLSTNPSRQLDLQKGELQSKIEFIKSQAHLQIDQLKQYLEKLDSQKNFQTEDFEAILQVISPSLKDIFIQIIAKEAKERCISDVLDTVKPHTSEVLSKSSEELLQNFHRILKKDGFIKYEKGRFKFMRNMREGRNSIAKDFSPQELLRSPSFSNLEDVKSLVPKISNKDIAIPLDQYDALIEGTKRGLELMIAKLDQVVIRQEQRLQALNQGKTFILPQYFHATDLKAAASITQTGIDAAQSTSGFGAFVSTQPEFRYGHIILGLPRQVEFSSDIYTFIDKKLAPDIILDDGVVWAGLEESIILNPQVASLKRHFMQVLRRLVYNRCKELENGIDPSKRFLLEATILDFFSKNITFRSQRTKDKLKLTLHYYHQIQEEKESKNMLIPIKDEESLQRWTRRIFTAALAKIPEMENMSRLLVKFLLENFVSDFKAGYYKDFKGKKEGLEPPSDFSIEIPVNLDDKIKAAMIVPDDEEGLQDIYRRKRKNDRKSLDPIEFKAYTQVKEEFKQLGLSEERIELIPLTEQLLERDILNQIDLIIPIQWGKENN
ncbi:hypothetical protein [Candidatus Protochlamydia phocaeensis]|uniref:hypothetical protein n=1 Tax=Candidatus Protochlamydia phocaeensis TaxID=1414722 RepID=UPI000837F125|nr:hypothetical protein [Candidatus Protochlamydia phocaeensis]